MIGWNRSPVCEFIKRCKWSLKATGLKTPLGWQSDFIFNRKYTETGSHTSRMKQAPNLLFPATAGTLTTVLRATSHVFFSFFFTSSCCSKKLKKLSVSSDLYLLTKTVAVGLQEKARWCFQTPWHACSSSIKQMTVISSDSRPLLSSFNQMLREVSGHFSFNRSAILIFFPVFNKTKHWIITLTLWTMICIIRE